MIAALAEPLLQERLRSPYRLLGQRLPTERRHGHEMLQLTVVSRASSSGGFDHNQVAPDALTFADYMKLSLSSLNHFLYLPGVNDIHAKMETATLAPW